MTTKVPFDYAPYSNIVANEGMFSAQFISRLLMNIVAPSSVLDVGCGQGPWLRVFEQDWGLSDLVGIDGAWVDESKFASRAATFIAHDLNQSFNLGRIFDLVLALEVAEHLEPNSADAFVESLTRHGKVIAFSAAIPAQGGQNHINEQWPLYWVDKFRAKGYLPVDCVRRKLWDVPNMLWWYAQNLILFVDQGSAARFGTLPGHGEAPPLVHPTLFYYRTREADLSQRSTAELLGQLAARCRRRLRFGR